MGSAGLIDIDPLAYQHIKLVYALRLASWGLGRGVKGELIHFVKCISIYMMLAI
jgi:hypothetical protein